MDLLSTDDSTALTLAVEYKLDKDGGLTDVGATTFVTDAKTLDIQIALLYHAEKALQDRLTALWAARRAQNETATNG